MGRPHRLLYIEHSTIIGGSSVSLKELLIDAVAKGYDCHVICRNDLLAGFYKDLGAKPHVASVIAFDHNTAYFYKFQPWDMLRLMRVFLRTLISFARLYPTVKSIKPDVVHLNSSVLVLYTFYFRLLGLCNILHIRENIVKGYLGFRKMLIRWTANRFATFVICISEHELELVGTKPAKSFVVYNYIHEAAFVPKQRIPGTYSPNESLVLISLGGLFSLKGGKKLIQALKETKADVKLLLVGTEDPRINRDYLDMIEGEAYTNEIIQLLNDTAVSGKVEMVGKVKDPATYIDRAQALIFWAERPHFPRTVFEAWILKKPVLYYNHGFRNPVINSSTVLEVKDDSPSSLSHAMTDLRSSEVFRPESIQKCYELAQANFSEKNFNKIDDIYRRCIEK